MIFNLKKKCMVSAQDPGLNPYFVTGFIDGEGCFSIDIYENNKLKIGWCVKLTFIIVIHKKDQDVLKYIQNYLKVGRITKHRLNSVQFRIESIKDLVLLINHFDNYPLITQKRADYKLLKSAFKLMERGEHLTSEGLKKNCCY